MHSPRRPHRGFATALAVVVLVAAGCGSSSAPATSATASSATATTTSPAVSVAASPASASPAAASLDSPGGDPAASLSIAPPYTLEPLEATQAAQFEASLKAGLGALSSIVQVGARQVKKAGANDGLVLAMAFPGVPVPGSLLDSIAASAGGANAKVTSRTIEGQDVRLIEGETTHIAAYLHGSTVVFAYGQSADETVAIITAVIQASH